MFKIIFLIALFCFGYWISRPEPTVDLIEICEEWIANNPEPHDAYCEEE